MKDFAHRTAKKAKDTAPAPLPPIRTISDSQTDLNDICERHGEANSRCAITEPLSRLIFCISAKSKTQHAETAFVPFASLRGKGHVTPAHPHALRYFALWSR